MWAGEQDWAGQVDTVTAKDTVSSPTPLASSSLLSPIWDRQRGLGNRCRCHMESPPILLGC